MLSSELYTVNCSCWWICGSTQSTVIPLIKSCSASTLWSPCCLSANSAHPLTEYQKCPEGKHPSNFSGGQPQSTLWGQLNKLRNNLQRRHKALFLSFIPVHSSGGGFWIKYSFPEWIICRFSIFVKWRRIWLTALVCGGGRGALRFCQH